MAGDGECQDGGVSGRDAGSAVVCGKHWGILSVKEESFRMWKSPGKSECTIVFRSIHLS